MARRRWTGTAVAALALGAVVTIPDPSRAQVGGPCRQPYVAVWAEHWLRSPAYGRQQVWPEHPVRYPSVDTEPFADEFAAYDTDGDGNPDGDARVPNSQELRFPRLESELIVSVPGSGIRDVRGLGDLDGDGRDEVIIEANGVSPDEAFTYVLPGSTPAGTRRLSEVGLSIPPTRVVAVGDQDGDRSDDLLVGPTSRGTSIVVSGRAVMTSGIPTALPPIGPELPGVPGGAWPVDPGSLTYASIDGRGPGTTMTVVRRGVVSTWTTPPTVDEDLESVSLLRTDGRTFLFGGRGSDLAATYVLWDLEDPCRALPARIPATTTAPPPPPTTAPSQPPLRTATPASPVTASPRFTG